MCKLILSFLFILIILGQSTEYLQDLSIENYFANRSVNDIKQDRNGFIWIATNNGLFRYDGYGLIKYDHSNSNLQNISINSIFFDKKDNIWLLSNIISKLQLKNNKITNYEFKFDNQYFGNNNLIDCYDDSISLWITSLYGLIEFRKRTGETTQYLYSEYQKEASQNNFSRFINVSDSLYIVGKTGLKIFLKNSRKFLTKTYRLYKERNDPNNDLYSIAYLNKKVWIGGRDGLYQFDTTNKKFIKTLIQNEIVSNITILNNKKLLISTQYNPFVYDTKTHKSISVLNSKIKNRIKGTFEDASGLVWLNRFSGGLIILDNYQKRIFSFEKPDLEIRFFYEDISKGLWVGSQTNILLHKHKENVLIDKFNLQKHLKTSAVNPQNRIYSMVQDMTGKYWIATGSGLYLYSKDYKFIDILKSDGTSNSISSNYIFSLTTDSNYIWLATFKGLNKINVLTKKITHLDLDTSVNLWHVVKMMNDDNYIWLKQQSDLYRLDKQSNRIERTFNNISFFDVKSYLWVTKDREVLKFNKYTLQLLDSISLEEDNSDRIVAILPNNNSIWYSDTKGISKYSIKNKSIKSFNSYEGITPGRFSFGSSKFTTNGLVYFGKANGFHFLNSNDFLGTEHQIKVYLSSFKGGEVIHNTFESFSFKTPYKSNDIEISFSTLEFKMPKRNRYRYRFKSDIDSEWIYLGYLNKINFVNLQPDDYLIEISATNNSGIWSKKTTTAIITVLPPYWQTLWFQFLGLILFVIALYAAYKIRVNKLLEIDRIKQRISTDLHDDLGTSLTKISMFSQLVEKSDSRIKYVGDIKRIANDSIQALDDIVWAVDPRNDSLHELVLRIEEFLSDTFSRLNTKYKFKKHINSRNKPLNGNIRKNIYLILKEAINNVIKHSMATDVQVEISLNGDLFSLKVKDNGQGISISKCNRIGNGLKNMQLRAEQMRSSLNIETENGFQIELLCKI